MATAASNGSDPLLEVASDPSRGRYYVARRGIAESEVLLRVRPDVWAPAWPGDGEAAASLSKRESAVIVCDAGFSGAAQQALGILAAGWLLLVRAALLPDEAWPSRHIHSNTAPLPRSLSARCVSAARHTDGPLQMSLAPKRA